MSSDDWEVLWQDALEQYKKETGSDPPVYFAVKEDITVDDILAVALDQKEAFDAFRSKGERLRKALNPTVFVIQTAVGTAAHIAKMTFRPAEAIFSGLVVLLKAAEGVSEKYDRIVEMLEDLDDVLERVNLFVKSTPTLSMKKLVVDYLCHIIAILGLATKAVRQGRSRKYFKTLLCKDSKVKNAFEKLDRLATREGLVVTSATLSATNEVLKTVEEGMKESIEDVAVLHDMILAIAEEASAISENNQNDRALLEEIRSLIPPRLHSFVDTQLHSNIHIWLGASNSTENYLAGLKKHTPGTGVWLMRDERYIQWKTQADTMPLWLYGKPGAGKSVLVSTVIKDIIYEQHAHESVFYAYFYFDFRDRTKQKCHELVASLVEQLAFSHPTGFSMVENLYKQRQSSSRSNLTLDELTDVLRDILEVLADGKTYIIVDALDECTEREALMDLLQVICEWRHPRMFLLLASRKETEINDTLSSISVGVDLETSVVDPDISCYIETALQEHPKLKKWREHPTVPMRIRECLSEANGMFRWAFCQLDVLSRCINAAAIFKALRSLPASLSETYERILLGIGDDHFEQVFAVLQWLAFSKDPMTLAQIIEVLAIDFEENPPVFSIENRPPDSNDIAAICASLVTVNSNDCLELAHFSVKEYLSSSETQNSRAARYHITSLTAHTFIARCSLAYLHYFSKPLEAYFPDGYIEEGTYYSGKEVPNYPLALYAAKNWQYHSTEGNFNSLKDPILSLFRCPENRFQNSIRIYNPDHCHSNHARRNSNIASRIYYAAFLPDPVITASFMGYHEINEYQEKSKHGYPLHAASFRGNEKVIKYLLENGADVNAQGGYYGNALQAASSEGYKAIVEMLLERGADINAQGGYYGNALQAALFGEHETIVELLLEKRADVNAQGGYFGNALQAASLRGHDLVLRLLLEKGANINAQGGLFSNALQAASYEGHGAIVEMLLERGADINAQGGYYGNALQAASLRGHKTIVEILLEEGADVNAQGGYFGNALQAASSEGYKAVVEILLEEGADVNAQGGYFGNALQAASSEGYKAVVELLLEMGADLNAWGGLYGNALQAASLGGHKTIVEIPLEEGADVNAQGGWYGNALQAASLEGYKAIVEMLLEEGADVNAQGGHYGNALQAASYRGHQTIVELLLEKGADVNAQGGNFGNALQAASWGGHGTIVEILLEEGANVNAQGGLFSNALQAASYEGHGATVEILLEKGANVNAQGGNYGKALQAASYRGHQTIVELLLEKGADVNAQGGDFGNALQAASLGGHKTIVELLLEKGADVNAQGGCYGNALQAASCKGQETIVEMLLEEGAGVNAQGGFYGNALQAASYQGHGTIVELLLEKGANVNARGGFFNNALQAACSEGYKAIVEMLLEKGADANAQGGEFGNALCAAKARRRNDIVDILLKDGAREDPSPTPDTTE